MIYFVVFLFYMDVELVLSCCYQKFVSGGVMFCIIVLEEFFFLKILRKLYIKIDLGFV